MPANFLKLKQIVNIQDWHLRHINVGFGTRDKVVVKQTNRGKVYFLVKTYDKDVGELRSEVCASRVGSVLGFAVQRSWLCYVPQYKRLGLKHPRGVLIQLDVRRQRDTRRGQFREDLVHGAALISLVDRHFGRLKNELEGRKLYTLEVVVKSLRNYVSRVPDAKIVWEQFFRLLAFDAIIGGTDRHYHNWGILVEADTGRFLRLAPAFDNGISLLWKMEEYGTAFMHDLLTQNFVKKARSMFKKKEGGKYTLYGVLEELYALSEYRGIRLASLLLKQLNATREADIKKALQHVPISKRFEVGKHELGLICAYVTVRLGMLKQVLERLADQYDST